MLQYWPNYNYDPSSPDYTEFWQHEWSKHGTCTGLEQYTYFNTALQMFKKVRTRTVGVMDALGSASTSGTEVLGEGLLPFQARLLRCLGQPEDGVVSV